MNKAQRIEEYNKQPWTCKQCNKVISYDTYLVRRKQVRLLGQQSIFCSLQCAGTFNKIGISKKDRPLCKVCGQKCNELPQKYCSHKCQWIAYRNYIDTQIENGKWIGKASYKRYIKAKQKGRCAICQITEWIGQPISLILDHIDGNPYNNELSNLRMICSNCDSQLPTYKGKNAGNGRHSRRDRYRKGLSY